MPSLKSAEDQLLCHFVAKNNFQTFYLFVLYVAVCRKKTLMQQIIKCVGLIVLEDLWGDGLTKGQGAAG